MGHTKTNLIIALVGLLGLAGCKEIKGTLQVDQPIQLLNKKGEAIDIQNGDYQAKLKVNTKKNRVRLKIKLGDKQTVYFKVPPSVQIPRTGGRADIPSSQNGQNYDVVALVNTGYSESGQYQSTESCVYDTRTIRRWRWKCNRHGDCHREWYWDTEIIYGEREYTYHYVYKTKGMRFLLTTPGTDNELARFQGSKTKSSKVRDWTGPCTRW